MQKHRGQILEAVVRKSGYTIKCLTEKLGISRNTIYHKFREHDLSYDFIVRVGDAIHYDFTDDYPEINTRVDLVDRAQHAIELQRLERRYTLLLEHYDKLLRFLVRTASDYRLRKLKREIDDFLEQPR